MSESPRFPSTRYQGSKSRLIDWLWTHLAPLDFDSALDAFGGTGTVAYRFKQAGKRVTYNDALRFNHQIGLALIENDRATLSDADIDALVNPQPGAVYPDFVQRRFGGVYFTDAENAFIDRTITHIRSMESDYQRALAFFALAQSCLVKRPYNLFHRKNLYLRLADVPRSFGNKTAWDRPFERWFRRIAAEANHAIFANGRPNHALNYDARDIPGAHDLVYIDPPYISVRGAAVDYRDFYHFLEGLTVYDAWPDLIDADSKHLRLQRQPSVWTDKRRIHSAFAGLFNHYRDSILAVSYRADGIPAESELVALMKQVKRRVTVHRRDNFQYALSTRRRSGELLIIGE